jgi:anti-sigma factor RsiW
MHPDTELTGYVTDTLAPAARARVTAHLQACADCRRVVEDSHTVLTSLAAGPAPPPIDWARYRADLRGRMRARGRRAWWASPLPAVLGAGVATAVLLLALHGIERRPGELAAVEQTMLGARLPLLRQYRVVERLDLLEDLEAIRQLDRLGGGAP